MTTMIGFLNINKPAGCSSAKVVAKVKKQLKADKVGHMGTLDPLASGVLPIAIGKATRMFDYFLEKTKSYTAWFTFGKTTATLDSEGEVLDACDIIPTLEQIKAKLPDFVGEIEQMPPEYSAKKVNGVCAYKLARNNVDFYLKPKKVSITKFDAVKQISTDTFEFEITCGSGTYIRSLARDLAKALGTLGYMSKLVRTVSGVFNLDKAISLETIENSESLEDLIIPIEKVFTKIKVQDLDKIETKKLCDGQSVDTKLDNNNYFIHCNGDLICVANVIDHKMKLKTYLKG